MSALQGPSIPIDEEVELHRLFERNKNSYPDNMAIIHEGTLEYTYNNIFHYS